MRTIFIVRLIGLLVLVPARWARADVAADLSQAEGQYKARQYTQAEQSYLKVINEADPNKPAEAEAAFSTDLTYLDFGKLEFSYYSRVLDTETETISRAVNLRAVLKEEIDVPDYQKWLGMMRDLGNFRQYIMDELTFTQKK